jgi:hypothetical protein
MEAPVPVFVKRQTKPKTNAAAALGIKKKVAGTPAPPAPLLVDYGYDSD